MTKNTTDRARPAALTAQVRAAMGFGLAFVIPFWNTLSMFLGAFIAWLVMKQAEAFAERYTIPVAFGIIAGESLMGVLIALIATMNLAG